MNYIEIVLGAIVTIIAALNVRKWKELKWKGRLLLIGGIFLALITCYDGINSLRDNNFLKKITASYGDLEDVRDATIPAVQIGMLPNAPKFLLNETGVFTYHFKPNEIVEILKLYVKHNKLFVNAIIYDTSGIPIAGIFENTWKIYNSNFEFNYDNQAIELVTNATHYVIFHIDIKTGVAHIEGCFYLPKESPYRRKGRGLKLFTSYKNDMRGVMYYLHPNESGLDSTIHPIFKYPKEKYLGIRTTY